MPTREWSPWRHRPEKRKELASLEKTLREMRIQHWSMTQYARHRQGAPDLLLPQLRLAVWLLSVNVTPRQEREQAAMRALGWTVIIPITAQAAMEVIQAKGKQCDR